MKKQTITKTPEKGVVLITGGAGFLGINLARHLHTRGYGIRIVDIAPFDYKDMAGKVDYRRLDIRDLAGMENACAGVRYVVHTAAGLPLYKPEDIYSTDLTGTENVLKAANKNGAERVVHISSTAVYGIPKKHPIYEDYPKEGVGPYGEAKVKAEEVCHAFRKRGMIISILRPKSFVGPERLGVMAIYYDWIRRGKNIPIVGSGKNRYQLLDVEDLCDAIELCLTRPVKDVNDDFNIGAKEFTTMKGDFGAVLDYAGHGKRIIPIPAKPLILTLRFLEILRLSPLYKWVYETAPEDSFVSIEKAEKKLGFRPKHSTKDALIRNYEWYLSHYKEFEDQEGVSHRKPWKQGILRLISHFF